VIFWMNPPIGLAAFAMFGAYLHERLERRPHRVDYTLGAAALGAGCAMTAPVQRVLRTSDGPGSPSPPSR
jgi:hypothetical protein